MNKQHVKWGLFFSATHKTSFVFRGLKMLFFKNKLENGVFFKSWGSENINFQEKWVVLSKLTLKDLMPIPFSSPKAQPEVVHFLISNESPYFSSCKSKISASNSL